MINNLGARLQNTWQRLCSNDAQPEALPDPRNASDNNAAAPPRSAIRAPNERSIAGRLRQALHVSIPLRGAGSARVQEQAAPVRDNLRTYSAIPEVGLEPLSDATMSEAVANGSPLSERPSLSQPDVRLASRGTRTFARQPPQRTNSVMPSENATSAALVAHAQSSETIPPQSRPQSFDHAFAKYDLTFPFQARFDFESEQEAHDAAKKHGIHAQDYALKTQYLDDDPTPIVTMELRSTANLQQNWKQFAFDPSTAFDDAKSQLLKDAKDRMQQFAPSATRPSVQLPQDASMPTLFKSILGKTDALVIGESHSDLASKKAVIDTMPTLRAAGATHFFLEHIPGDTFKAEIAEYNASPAGTPIPPRLNDYLDKLDSDYMRKFGQSKEKSQIHDLQAQKYGFKAMVKAIHDGGMELCCIDREISYHVPGNFKGYNQSGSHERGMMFNTLAAQQNERLPEGAKSVWFIGEAHANTHEGIPGQAELHNGIAVVISDKRDDSDEVGLRANVKNHNGHQGLNPDLVMMVDLSAEEASAAKALQPT